MFCSNCQSVINDNQIAKRLGYNHKTLVCNYCASATKVNTLYGECLSHGGEFDKNENPVTALKTQFMPGYRICGYADCIKKDHVIRDYEFERFNLLRDGKKLTPREFMAELIQDTI